jgi:transposase
VLRELGTFIPQSASQVLPTVRALIDDLQNPLPLALRPALTEAVAEIQDFERRIKSIEKQLHAPAKDDPVISSLKTIPGIGFLTATALVAFVGDVRRFPSGRHFSSYLGLTPRKHSSGLARHLGRISKRGDPYLRMLLIHGARSVPWAAKKSHNPDRLRTWTLTIQRYRGHNKAVVALANKLARVAWAVWKHHHPFESKEVI